MDIHGLIMLVFLLLFVGALCFLVGKIPGIPAPIPVVIQIIIALIFLLYLFDNFFGSGGGHLGRIGCS